MPTAIATGCVPIPWRGSARPAGGLGRDPEAAATTGRGPLLGRAGGPYGDRLPQAEIFVGKYISHSLYAFSLPM
jgi:hypothetical protein